MKIQLFAALIPLVVFWAVESYWGLKAALVLGCVTAVIEVVWEKLTQKRVSFLTATSNGLMLGLGTLSFAMDSGVAFKLQPMVMEVAMALVMAIMRLRGGEPFMVRTFASARGVDALQRTQLMANPIFTKRLRSMDTVFIGFLFLHGLAVGAAALWGSTGLWILLKGVLFYVLMVLVFIPFLRRPRAASSVDPHGQRNV